MTGTDMATEAGEKEEMSVWADIGDLNLPADGASIKWRKRRESEWREGVVDFCWMGIEPAIKLTDGTDVFPTLGDQFEAL